MLVCDISGVARLFELKDGNSLRLLARERVTVPDSNLTPDFQVAQKMGFIYMLPDKVVPPSKSIKK